MSCGIMELWNSAFIKDNMGIRLLHLSKRYEQHDKKTYHL